MKKCKFRLEFLLLGICITLSMGGCKAKNEVHVSNTNETPVSISLSEPFLNQKELLQVSDLVAEVRVDKIKEKTIKTFETDAEKGKKIKVEAPIIIYDVEVIEIVKGLEKDKKIDLVIPDVNITSMNVSFKEGSTYFLYLYKNENYGNKAYSLASASHGQFEVNDSSQIVVDKQTVKLQTYKEDLKSILEME